MSGLKLPGLPDQLRGESEAGFDRHGLWVGLRVFRNYIRVKRDQPSKELNPLIREAFHRIKEDGTVRTNLPETSDLTSPLARSEAARPRVKATRGQNRRTKARCAIAALVS